MPTVTASACKYLLFQTTHPPKQVMGDPQPLPLHTYFLHRQFLVLPEKHTDTETLTITTTI
jgi:hypothetical protein